MVLDKTEEYCDHIEVYVVNIDFLVMKNTGGTPWLSGHAL